MSGIPPHKPLTEHGLLHEVQRFDTMVSSPPNSPILLVEDDLSLRYCLDQFLQEHGYRTVVASNLRQAWELLHAHRPWLCLLDLNLPDGSGLDLLKRFASNGCACRTIVMTAFDLQNLRPANIATVLAGWLNKPVNPAELLSLVQAEESRCPDTISRTSDNAARRDCERP